MIELTFILCFVAAAAISHSLLGIVYAGLIVIAYTLQFIRVLRLLRHAPPGPA